MKIESPLQTPAALKLNRSGRAREQAVVLASFPAL
jgi:hypothetical protein